ncbi:MAG: hypothetical protein JXN59_16555 [Anaerolineae bacterium]|nr:hypothetical protein [Anaerolineae bacterium]
MGRFLTIQRLMVAILFILIFAMAVRTPVDTDTWWHLRVGEYQVVNRTVVGEDLFSHTRSGAPWTNHSWGSQVVMYGVYHLFGGQGQPGDGGNIGLALLMALLATGGMAFVYAASQGSPYIRAFSLVLGAAAAAVFWSPRPQMFTFFFSAVVYFLLMRFKWRQDTRALWGIPLVILVWGNMHAGFATAFILMVGVLAGEVAAHLFGPVTETTISWRGLGRLLLVMAVSVLALVINPFGLEMLKVPFATVNIGVLQDFIQEWASPNFHERQTWPFIFLLIGALGFAGLSRERLDWSDLALVSGTGFMALLAGRNIALFAVVATPVLIRHADAFLTDRGWVLRSTARTTPGRARLNWVLLALIALGGLAKVWYAVNPAFVREAQIAALPVEAAAYISENRLAGLMFNSYNWGGYLMFAAPEAPVFVDGRTDLYGDDLLREYLRVAFVRDGWEAVLDTYEIGWVVIEAQGGLAAALRQAPGWSLTYEDDLAVIFVREGAA